MLFFGAAVHVGLEFFGRLESRWVALLTQKRQAFWESKQLHYQAKASGPAVPFLGKDDIGWIGSAGCLKGDLQGTCLGKFDDFLRRIQTDSEVNRILIWIWKEFGMYTPKN